MIGDPKPHLPFHDIVGERMQWSRHILDPATTITDRVVMTRHVRIVVGGAIFVAEDLLRQPMPHQQVEGPVHRSKTDLRLVLTRRQKHLLRSWMRSRVA